MAIKLRPTEMRATIFAPPIVYNAINLKKVSSVLPANDGFVPRTFDLPALPGMVIQFMNNPHVEWEMFSEKTGSRIHFNPQKIDVIKSFNSISDTVEESNFCKYSSKLLKAIVEEFSFVPTRLAFAPTYDKREDDNFKIKEFFNSIFKVNTFGETESNGFSFRQTYRQSHKIQDKEYEYNLVIQVNDGVEIVTNEKGQKSYPLLTLKLDINTVQGNAYEFNSADLNSFFETAPELAKHFIHNYIS